MGKKNTSVERLLSDEERFADLFNAHFYNGKQVIKAENLRKDDTVKNAVIKDKNNKNVFVERFRDINMTTELGTKLVLLTCENQTKIHYAMAVRSMLYDALDYMAQVEKIAKKNKEEKNYKDSDEFLSGLTKDDRLKAILPLVFYYGDYEWDTHLDLHSLLDMDETEYELLKDYLPNYRINLVDARELAKKNCLHTDLQLILGMLEYKQDKKKLQDYMLSHEDYFRNVDRDSYNAAAEMLGAETQLKKFRKSKKGGMDMCKALDDLYQDGKNEGFEQKALEIAKNLLDILDVETIAERVGLPLETVQNLKNNQI